MEQKQTFLRQIECQGKQSGSSLIPVNFFKVLHDGEISSDVAAGLPIVGRRSVNSRKHPRFHTATYVTGN